MLIENTGYVQVYLTFVPDIESRESKNYEAHAIFKRVDYVPKGSPTVIETSPTLNTGHQ